MCHNVGRCDKDKVEQKQQGGTQVLGEPAEGLGFRGAFSFQGAG